MLTRIEESLVAAVERAENDMAVPESVIWFNRAKELAAIVRRLDSEARRL